LNQRRATLLVLLAAMVAASQWLLQDRRVDAEVQADPQIGYYLLDGTLRGVADDGSALFAISAARVQQQPALARVDLERVDVTWADNETLPWRLTAAEGSIGDDWRQLELRGDVRIEGLDDSGAPVTLETDRLTVLLAEKRATTASDVRVAGTDGAVFGTGMVADLVTQRFRLESAVRGRFMPRRTRREFLP
jgi:LPS export ABC transporter protein LptC